jgi:hypothetical protein
MLSILHVYDENDTMAARYVAMLSDAMGEGVHAASVSTAAQLKEVASRQPAFDIVHIHGCPAFFVKRSEIADHNVQRFIITPHGHPLPRVSAYVVVARSPMEYDILVKLHPHVETVRNPIITRTTTPANCAAQMMHIYQRVAHSYLLPLMSPSSRQALATLLCVAIGDDAQWAPHPLPADADYPQLQAYAQLEGVLPLVTRGLQLMEVEVPQPEQIEGYLPAGYQVPSPLNVERLTLNGDHSDAPPMFNVQRSTFNESIPALLADIKAHGPSLLRLCEVAQALHDDNLDEDRLMQLLDEQRLHPLMASLLTLLSQQVLLTEGFMPCQPADDRLARQLQLQLETRQCPIM